MRDSHLSTPVRAIDGTRFQDRSGELVRANRWAPQLTATVSLPSADSALIPKKLYKIGEVMRYSGLTRQTVHNYTMFGLITETERTRSGHRLYGEEVFPRLERIRELKKEGRSLREIAELLDASPSPESSDLQP